MKPIKLAIATLLIFTTSGCVTYTSVKDEPRQKVRFRNAQAAQTFYDAYLAAINPKPQRSIAVGIGFTFPYYHWEKLSENISFNSAIQSTDRNHDKIISKKEASTFLREAKWVPPKLSNVFPVRPIAIPE
jgi:hypothetical protein